MFKFGRISEDRITQIESLIQELKKRIKEVLDDAIMQEYKQSITTGNDLLLQGVLMDLLFMVTALDALDAPLEIIGLEQFYAGSIAVDGIGEVAISGTIDRIDRQGEYTRIIDYKTGKDDISAKTDIKALFSNPDKKAMLQLMFYTLLYKVKSPEAAVKAGIYKLRKMNAGIQWMDQGSIITNEMLGEFRKELQRVITEIFDPSISFSQTQDEKRCEFCDYNKICNRL